MDVSSGMFPHQKIKKIKSEEKPLTVLKDPAEFTHTDILWIVVSEFKFSIEFRYLSKRNVF